MTGWVRCQVDGNSAVVTAGGQLDLAVSPLLRAALLDGGAAHLPVSLDLAQVSFVDSFALGVLVACNRALQARGSGPLVIVGASPRVLTVLRITGLLGVLAVSAGCLPPEAAGQPVRIPAVAATAATAVR